MMSNIYCKEYNPQPYSRVEGITLMACIIVENTKLEEVTSNDLSMEGEWI